MPTSQEWIDALGESLQESIQKSKFDRVVDYGDVARAFPAGPHSNYFELNAIDFDSLKSWANANGWNVTTAPECTHPEQQTIPKIRFTKIGYVPTTEEE